MFCEDRDYVKRVLAGEPEMFEALVRRYSRLAGAIAFGVLGDSHLAEDVVQESFLKAFRALPSLREPTKFKQWFAGVVRSKAIDALRRRRSMPDASVDQELLAEWVGREDENLEPAQVREELRQKVLAAVAELPEEDRMVVVLKHMEGLSYKEIAALTESTVSAVESRLFRARQALRRRLPAERS